MLAATGHCFWVDSDDRLDAVTAESGSGPAYVFHFLESFQLAAEVDRGQPEAAACAPPAAIPIRRASL